MGPGYTALSSSRSSLITSILSAGTFFGAIIAGDLADMMGRRPTIIAGCAIYSAGVVIQCVLPSPHLERPWHGGSASQAAHRYVYERPARRAPDEKRSS